MTDIAKLKDSDNPRYIIQNWLRNRNTIEFLGVWESLYNPSFNRVEFDAFRHQAERLAKLNAIERGSTFGTVFLDCPESRPSFYSQSLAIQGFCHNKLLVRIWTLKSKQLKMAAEAAENLESEPLFPETGLLLFSKKCVLILLWRLEVQSGMRAFLIIKSNVFVDLLSHFSL